MKVKLIVEIDTKNIDLPEYDGCEHYDDMICDYCMKVYKSKAFKSRYHKSILRGAVKAFESLIEDYNGGGPREMEFEDEVEYLVNEEIAEFYPEGAPDDLDTPSWNLNFKVVKVTKPIEV